MDLEAKVKKVIAESLAMDEGKTINNKDAFVNDLEADSLDIVELVLNMENAFEISIPDDEAEKVVTVQDVIDLVGEKVKENVNN